MAAKRKLSAISPATEDPVDPAEELMFLCLGGGNEVGRSCHILQYKGKTVMLDAGMHPAYDGLAALPFYDDFDLSTVDVLLISHFHVDHAASLPYVMAKTNFQGRVFMTHPTKAIYKWLIQDSVRVGNTSSTNQQAPLYTEADHLSTFSQIEAIDYHTTHTISSIRITPYPAGHVLGAAMFLIEIAGLKILFTGDYSREDDRHLISAEVPKGVKIDVLITESTYGIASHIPRLEREAALMKSITGILHRGGRVLMPVFALGRAQELLLILDEYWTRHPEFQKVPIYYASNLARKCMVVYQTYVGAMNDNIKRLFRERMAEAELAGNVGKGGPWDFKFIRSLKNLDRFDDVGGCVMLASPGMLQNGVSRELLERWAPDPRNGVIVTGYSVEGTMAKQIMNEPDSIPAIMTRGSGAGGRGRGPVAGGEAEKTMIPRRCTVQEFSFAAHVDGQENREFIEEVASPVVILVHGEQHNMMRLKSKLLSLNVDKREKTKVFSPKNCEELKIPFKADKTAKVVGKLAQLPPPSNVFSAEDNAQLITGVLVQNDFKMSLMAPEDLREYAGLTTTTITCKQQLSLSAAGIGLVKWALEGMFGSVEVIYEGLKQNGESKANGASVKGTGASSDQEMVDDEVDRTCVALLVMGCVFVRCHVNGDVELEWEGNMLNDGIADAVMAVLFTVESSPAAVKYSSSKNHHAHDDDSPKTNPHANVSITERLERVLMFLESQFGHSITPIERPKIQRQETKAALATAGDIDTTMASQLPSEDEDLADLEAQELVRLHRLGIPVPGVEICVDKHIAKVWLETLEVECSYSLLRDRVRVVVERAVETVAPLWTQRKGVIG
ncbi:endoribonuclease ysh1 [Glutinoglossum americanum]|uniref:Endoribonuclease ysh1 n=1 Tax=Glutinoglossum americanum TaxID=1670608 RepID=A0A9P8KYZ3_9PEZI|nr:endoribonuclease ysh1 [Glutinoglossum americanum]